jgi:branched-chain amino acid transport system substrate-binding protein
LIFAPYSSELTAAIAPITEKYGYPVVTSAASDKLWQGGYKYLFGVVTPASRYAIGFLEMLANSGFKDVAIISADDAFSQSIADGTKQWAEKFGLKVLLFSEFKKGTKNFVDSLKKAKEAHASALIVCGHFDEAVNVRLSLKEIRWRPRAYYASIGPALQAFYEELGSDVDRTFFSAMWEYRAKLPGSKKFYEDFTKAFGKEPPYQAVEGYSSGETLEKAIKKAGSIDKEKIRGALSSMETMTTIGRYGVDKTGKQIKHFPLIMQWQKGKKEIVWPEDLSTAKPIFK